MRKMQSICIGYLIVQFESACESARRLYGVSMMEYLIVTGEKVAVQKDINDDAAWNLEKASNNCHTNFTLARGGLLDF